MDIPKKHIKYLFAVFSDSAKMLHWIDNWIATNAKPQNNVVPRDIELFEKWKFTCKIIAQAQVFFGRKSMVIRVSSLINITVRFV